MTRAILEAHADRLFFTSDSHFHHRGAVRIRHLNAGEEVTEAEVEEMNRTLIERWNEVVPKNGIVVHTGDFSFAGGKRTIETLEQLNGTIHLVLGNHDKGMTNPVEARFAGISEMLLVRACWDDTEGVAHKQRIVACHYPLLSWDMAQHGTWHVHGHSHGTARYPFVGKVLDVGVDCNDLRPFSFWKVAAEMESKSIGCGDYHGK